MKKRKLLYLFPLAGLILSGCDFSPEDILKSTGNFFTETIPDGAKDFVDGMLGRKEEEPSEQKEEEEQKPSEGEEGQQGGQEGGEHGGHEGGEGGEQETKKDFEGITFPSAIVTFDGQPHSIEISGDLPEGAEVSYAPGNTFTDVGEYEITATVSGEGYNDLVLHATLTILASDFAGLSFEDLTVEYDGEPHSIAVEGELPEGAEVSYAPGNSFTEIGEYEVTATVSCAGYTDLVLHATLTITIGNMTGITFADQEVEFDGNFHEIAPEIPAKYVDATVDYGENGNSFKASGLHVVNATISCPGYNDVELSAKLTIGPGPVASSELNIVDFEDMSDNDLVDEFTLEFYNNGWVTPQAAKLGIEKNQVLGSGTNTMKMTMTHQGSAFKATKQLTNNTYNKYKGFSIDTMMDSRAADGTMKVQVQFWFKDLPLPDAYAGYRNTYATYTLANNAPSVWTHWEIPFDDESLSIASSATITEYFLQAGYSVEEFSPYIDKVAIIITPNYKDGKNCYAYIDNVKLALDEQKVEERHIYGGRYGAEVGGNFLNMELSSDLTSAEFFVNGVSNAQLTAEKAGTSVTFKDAQYAGAGLTVVANIENDGTLTVSSVSGAAQAEYAMLEGLNFAKLAKLNYDLQNESTSNHALSDPNWKQEKYQDSWQTVTGQMNVRSYQTNVYMNMVTGYYMDYRYTYTNPVELGLANKFSVDIANDFSGCADIKVKARLIKSNGQEVFVIGDASNYELVPANTGNRNSLDGWVHIEQDFDPMNVRAVVVTVKSTRGSNDYFYVDNLKVEYHVDLPEPPVSYFSLADGEYYIWNSGSDAYRLTIADSQTTGTFTKCGSEDSYAVTVAIDGNNVTIKDAANNGAGLTVNAVLTEDNLMTVESVSGAMASVFSASLTGKTVKHSASSNLNFSDGTDGSYYQESHWTESKYGNSGWSDYAAPTDMRGKVDKNGNKVVNMHCGTGAKNFLYSPDLPFGPVNHLEVDLGNYWSSSAGELRYKISLLGSDGKTVVRYVAGDADNWATLAKDTSNGNLCVTKSFDFDLVVGYKLRITTSMASGEAYLYMDNLKVSYKAPEPAPAFVPTGDLLGGARIKCLTKAGSDTGYVTELNVGGAGNGDFSGEGVYLRMKNNTGVDTPITMKFNSTNGTAFGPKPSVDHTYFDASGNEIAGCAARTWGNYLMLPANFDGFIYMNYETQMSRIFGDADFDPAHMWRVYIEYSGFYDDYADFEIGDIFTESQRVLDGSELDAAAFSATWINQTGAVQEISQLEGGVVPAPAFTIVDGDYYIWNGSSDAFRLNIANSLTTATVSKCGGDSYPMTVAVDGETVTIKDSQYGGQGLALTASITADNTMKITAVSGQMASLMSGSLLNKTVKHCANVNLDFADGAGSGVYSESHWTMQEYAKQGDEYKWIDKTPDMNSRKDANNDKIVNLVTYGNTRNFTYTPDLPMGPVNHVSFDMANYFGSSAGDIQVKVSVIDGGGTKYYALGDANNFVTLAKDTSHGSVLNHYDLPINLCAGAKVQITAKCSAGNSYLYVDNIQVGYSASVAKVAYKLKDTSGWDINTDTPEFYAWVWGGSDPGHWEKLTLKTDDGNYFDVSLFNSYSYMKIVRVDPAATNKPKQGSYSYGSYDNGEIWNQTGDIALNGTGGTINFSF